MLSLGYVVITGRKNGWFWLRQTWPQLTNYFQISMDNLVGIATKKTTSKHVFPPMFLPTELMSSNLPLWLSNIFDVSSDQNHCDISWYWLVSWGSVYKGFLSCLYYMTVPYIKQITRGLSMVTNLMSPQSPECMTKVMTNKVSRISDHTKPGILRKRTAQTQFQRSQNGQKTAHDIIDYIE